MSEEAYHRMLEGIEFIKEQAKRIQPEDRILNSKEVMNTLSCSARSLQNYRDQQLITFSKIGGKILYSYSDVLDFVERHKVHCT